MVILGVPIRYGVGLVAVTGVGVVVFASGRG
jgi:hypothetical protein